MSQATPNSAVQGSPDFMSVAPRVSATPRDEIDRIVARLVSRRDAWVALGTAERAELLERCIAKTLSIANEWVEAACAAKGIDPKSPRAGEEWLGGPMTTLRNLRLYAEALRADGEPSIPRTYSRPDGQVVCEVLRIGHPKLEKAYGAARSGVNVRLVADGAHGGRGDLRRSGAARHARDGAPPPGRSACAVSR